jgi:hypothetical protein
MPINSITNNTGDELTLFGPSGATIDTIPNGKQSGQEPITIDAVAVGTRNFTTKVGVFQNNSAYTATLQSPGNTIGSEVRFDGGGKDVVTFTT